MSPEQIAILVAAVAGLAYVIKQEIPKLAKGWSERTHAERVTAETVRKIIARMELNFETRLAEQAEQIGKQSKRIDALTEEHRACTKALNDMTAVNEGQEARIVTLEAQVAKYEKALAAGEAERVELQRTIDAAGSDVHASVPVHIDVVVRNQTGES